VSSAGVLTANALGQYDVLATADNATATALVNIVPMPVASITVTPAQSLKIVGQNVQMTATLRDSTGALVTNRPLTWSTSNTAVATVTAGTGLVTVVSPGTATIQARSDGVTGTATVTVIYVPVKSVSVSPPTATEQAKKTVQFGAQPLDSAGAPLTGVRLANRQTIWSTSDSTKAVVNSDGLVTTRAEGLVDIRATVDGVMGKAVLTVTRPAPARVDITPTARNLAIGQSVQLTATARDSFNLILSGRSFAWSSSNTGQVTINQSGVATAAAWGTPTVSASTEGTTGTTTVVVTDTLWRKVSTLPPALAGQTLSRPAYDYQSGTLFLAKQNFDGVIWKRDQFNTWSQITPPQSTFGSCVALHFDSPSQDLLVSGCEAGIWKVRVSDGLITPTTGLDERQNIPGRQWVEIWDPGVQRLRTLLSPSLRGIGGVEGNISAVAWNPDAGVLIQGPIGTYAMTGPTRDRYFVYAADWSLFAYNGASGAWRTAIQGDVKDYGRVAPMTAHQRLAYCAGPESVWRFNLGTRVLERTTMTGSVWSIAALFTKPQSETPGDVYSSQILCDGARNQLWVIESTAEGGGIWRYLGAP
jgi:uncharacterized protein YjdB